MDNNSELPLVAILMVTYNHEKYIAQAIESILSQQTGFRFKLFVGEDCSKDNTRAICLEYERKYPDNLQVICTKENSLRQNATNMWAACVESGARYIAMCEGDDYWTDTHKLQKQVDFLETNPDFSFSFSAIEVITEKNIALVDSKMDKKLDREVFTIEDFILSYTNLAHTATLLFRSILPYPMPEFYYKAFSGDVFLSIILADKGKAKYFPEPMAVYRNHAGGVTKTEERRRYSNGKLMELYRNLDEYLGFKYHKLFRKRFLENARVQLIFEARDKKGLSRLKHYFKTFPEYLKFSDKINWKEVAYYHCILFFPFLLRFFKKERDNKMGV